jgi:hypothetical protein
MQSRDLRYVGVRMTPELQERLLAAARRQGDASLAAMVRRFCLDGLARDEQVGRVHAMTEHELVREELADSECELAARVAASPRADTGSRPRTPRLGDQRPVGPCPRGAPDHREPAAPHVPRPAAHPCP